MAQEKVTRWADVEDNRAGWRRHGNHALQLAVSEGVEVVAALRHPPGCNVERCPVVASWAQWEQWSQIAVRELREVEVGRPDALALLGRLVAVEYESDKWSPGDANVYRHEFRGRLPLLARDDQDLYVVRDGSRYGISERGITG